jgi:hypothetical protein
MNMQDSKDGKAYCEEGERGCPFDLEVRRGCDHEVAAIFNRGECGFIQIIFK